MKLLTSIKTGATAVALAASVAAAGFAAPAQAASITLNLGTPGFYFPGGVVVHFGDKDYFKYCWTDSRIITKLEQRGYDHVRIIRSNDDDDHDNKVWVIGRDDDGDWWQMRVDRCTHKVDKIHKLIFKKGWDKHNDLGGVHLQFTYNF